jgi:hypothetical protein
MSKIEIKMRQRIILKIATAGATSKMSAVSSAEANLDAQEQFWLPYLIGGFSKYKILGVTNKCYKNALTVVN